MFSECHILDMKAGLCQFLRKRTRSKMNKKIKLQLNTRISSLNMLQILHCFRKKSKSQASLAYELITDRCHMWLVTFIFSSLNAKSCLDCQTTQAICTSFQRCFLSQILWHTHRKHSGFHLKHSAMHLPSNVSGTISDGKFYRPYWIFSIESSLQLEKRWAGWRGYQGRELFCSI